MPNMLKSNLVPIFISTCALILVTLIGLIPVYQKAGSQPEQATGQADNAALVQRVEALERAAGETAVEPAEIPVNASNGRLRQEIDLINRGLANQTGRVSGIKKRLEGVVDEGGQLMPSKRVMDEIALVKRALVNLTKRINSVDDQLESLQTAAVDIDRLQQQMANADRAFIRLSGSLREEKQRGNQMADAMAKDKRHTGALSALLNEEKRRRDQMVVALGKIQKNQSDMAIDYADMKGLREVLKGILQSLPE